LINTTFLDFTIRSASSIQARLAPARHAIGRIISLPTRADESSTKARVSDSNSSSSPPGTILLHIFSNGGCSTAIQLARSLHKDGLDFASSLKGIIFDCCPGVTDFQRTYNAATHSLPPSQPTQSIGRLLLVGIVGLFTGLGHAGAIASVNDLRAQLNDPAVFGATARRLYLYSEGDAMVRWQDVEAHMAQARERGGYVVHGVRFRDGRHCALMLRDPGRYWDGICGFWGRDAGPDGDGFDSEAGSLSQLGAGMLRSRL
jgi:DNA repair protein RAD57